METQKKYKHKQTGTIVFKNPAGNYSVKNCDYPVYNPRFIENTSDWELIPETPKMEVLEGYVSTVITNFETLGNIDIFRKGEKNIPYNNLTEIIFIKNPTPEMKAVIKAIEGGKCY